MACPYEVTILGVNSALPVSGRHPSCQVLKYDDTLLMIDCGEGSQSQLSKYNIRRSKISDVFISHMHGDHVYGLPGLITTYSLLGRKAPLSVHGPVGLKRYLTTILEVSEAVLSYDLSILEYDPTDLPSIYIAGLEVSMIPLQHRIPTIGYVFVERVAEVNIDKAAIDKYSLTVQEILAAKAKRDIVRVDKKIPWQEVAQNIGEPRAYAYISDSIYDKSLVPHLQGVSTLYHETTYLDDMIELATDRGHSTLGQAVDIAKSSGVQRLITGHYSSRYQDIQVFEEEGRKLWPHVVLGQEGTTYQV